MKYSFLLFFLFSLTFCVNKQEKKIPLVASSEKAKTKEIVNKAAGIEMKLALNNYSDTTLINKAIDLYSKCIEIDPSNKLYYTKTSTLLNKQGKYDEAINALNNAIEIDANFAEAYMNIGFIKEIQGDKALAEDNYNKAINLYLDKISSSPEKDFQYLPNIIFIYLMKEQRDSANIVMEGFPKSDSIHAFAYTQIQSVFENFDKEDFIKNFQQP